MIGVACQTYTWEMLGDAWRGTVDEILDAVAGAGYAGIEITNTMIEGYARRPKDFRNALDTRGLQLAAFAFATTGFTDPGARRADLEGFKRSLGFVSVFPAPRLGLGGAALPEAASAERRPALDRAIGYYNEAGRLGLEEGVSVNVHPHSHFGSLLESAEEYRYLMERLDPSCVSLGPDTGHIVRGGQDLLACLRTHRARITHLHLKDATAEGSWAPLGKGVCNFPAVLSFLEETGWRGWIVAEEESDAARADARTAIRANREYLRSLGY